MDSWKQAARKFGNLAAMDVDLLATWAHGQGTAFLTKDAVAEGYTRRTLDRAVSKHVLRDLGRGVLVSRELWERSHARARHRIEVQGRLLRKTSRWLAGSRSAAIVHDLPLLGKAPPIEPQLIRAGEGSGTKSKSRHERVVPLDDAEREEVEGIAVSSLARTVIDIAREEEFRSGLIVADGALRRGLTQSDLLALGKHYAWRDQGLAAVRVAQLANGLHETPLESLSWAAAHTGGFPMPEPQIRVYLGSKLIARVDGLWREVNVIGQADGLFKYKDRQGVIADKKQDEMLEDVGFEVCRWGWDEAYRPEKELYDRWRRAFHRGARQTLDPRVRLVPTTLEESLRWTGLIAS